MKKLSLISIFLIVSCTTKLNHREVHRDYMDTVKRAQKTMDKKQFVSWLKVQIKHKENEIEGYGGLENREGRILENHQQREQEQGIRQSGDVYAFKRRSSEMRIHNFNKKKEFVKRELLMLRSMLVERD